MKVQVDKIQEQQRIIIPKLQKEPSTGGTATIADNRPATVYQRKLQETMRTHTAQKASPMQRKTPKGSSRFQQIATVMGEQHGVDTSGLEATHNSSFPAKLNAEATIQGNKIHFAPGMDTDYNIRHEVAHAIDNTINGTPKGDQLVNGQKVDTTREKIVDRMAREPMIQCKSKVTINDGAGLGNEADVMESRAVQGRGVSHVLPLSITSGNCQPVLQCYLYRYLADDGGYLYQYLYQYKYSEEFERDLKIHLKDRFDPSFINRLSIELYKRFGDDIIKDCTLDDVIFVIEKNNFVDVDEIVNELWKMNEPMSSSEYWSKYGQTEEEKMEWAQYEDIEEDNETENIESSEEMELWLRFAETLADEERYKGKPVDEIFEEIYPRPEESERIKKRVKRKMEKASEHDEKNRIMVKFKKAGKDIAKINKVFKEEGATIRIKKDGSYFWVPKM